MMKRLPIVLFVAGSAFAADVQVNPPTVPTQLGAPAQKIVCLTKCKTDFEACIARSDIHPKTCEKARRACEDRCG